MTVAAYQTPPVGVAILRSLSTAAILRADPSHTTPEVMANAQDFVQTLGTPVVLTLVPNMHGCQAQMREVAQAVGLEIAEPSRTNYSSWDGGGHLDRNGSIAFTNDFVTELEKTLGFQALSRNDVRRR
jgi:hypothetical protein